MVIVDVAVVVWVMATADRGRSVAVSIDETFILSDCIQVIYPDRMMILSLFCD